MFPGRNTISRCTESVLLKKYAGKKSQPTHIFTSKMKICIQRILYFGLTKENSQPFKSERFQSFLYTLQYLVQYPCSVWHNDRRNIFKCPQVLEFCKDSTSGVSEGHVTQRSLETMFQINCASRWEEEREGCTQLTTW